MTTIKSQISALTEGQAAVLSDIVNNNGIKFANQIHCVRLQKKGLVMSHEYLDERKGTYWHPTDTGRTALKAYQDTQHDNN